MFPQDLGTHGIAPRKVTTAPNFAQKGGEGQKRQRPFQEYEPSVIPGEAPLQNLIVPARYVKWVWPRWRGMASFEGCGLGQYQHQSIYMYFLTERQSVLVCFAPWDGGRDKEWGLVYHKRLQERRCMAADHRRNHDPPALNFPPGMYRGSHLPPET